MNPKSLRLLEVNARYMRHEQFRRLVENIARDGALTSVPLALGNGDGSYTVLSGNHRVKAAIEAGLTEIDVMLSDDELTEKERLAVQLSHNAIVGQDDPQLLRQLYDSIDDIDLRLYSGLDDKQLDMLDDVAVPSLREATLNYAVVTLMFLPEEKEAFEEVIKEAMSVATGGDRYALAMKDYRRYLDTMDLVGRSYNVKNTAVVMGLVLDVINEHIGELREGWVDEEGEPRFLGKWVPIITAFDRHDAPVEVMAVVNKAVQRMIDNGDIKKGDRWRALEIMAAEYLAG